MPFLAPRALHSFWHGAGYPGRSPCGVTQAPGLKCHPGARSIPMLGLTTRCSGLASLAAELGIVRPPALGERSPSQKSRSGKRGREPGFPCWVVRLSPKLRRAELHERRLLECPSERLPLLRRLGLVGFDSERRAALGTGVARVRPPRLRRIKVAARFDRRGAIIIGLGWCAPPVEARALGIAASKSMFALGGLSVQSPNRVIAKRRFGPAYGPAA